MMDVMGVLALVAVEAEEEEEEEGAPYWTNRQVEMLRASS
jgi:hypothetical protein